MKKVAIQSPDGATPPKFLSEAILTSNTFKLELSGQIGLDPKTITVVPGGITAETEQTFTLIKKTLSEVGWTLENITKARIFLTSMDDYQAMNEVYTKQFEGIVPPARFAIAVKELPLGAKIEIECVAEGNELSEKAKKKYL